MDDNEFRQFASRVLGEHDQRHADHEARMAQMERLSDQRQAEHAERMAAHEARMAAHEARMAAHEARMTKMDAQYEKLLQVQLDLARSHDEHESRTDHLMRLQEGQAETLAQMRLTLDAIKEILRERRN